MTEQGAHDRGSFEAQGSAFLKQNIAEKPEFDYAENRPPHSHRLADKTLTLSLRDKPERHRLRFGEKDLDLEVSRGLETGGSGSHGATQCRTKRSSWLRASSSSPT